MATYPQSIADYIAGLNDEDFINGGHRSNFIPTAQGTRALAYYVQDSSISFTEYVDAKAIQVAADAASAAAGSGTEASIAAIRAAADVAHYISMRRAVAAQAPVALAFGTPIELDLATGINFKCLMTANAVLANPTNQIAGSSGFIDFVQDGTGGRGIASYGSNYVWIGFPPVWSQVPAGKLSKVAYFVASAGQVQLTFAGNSQ